MFQIEHFRSSGHLHIVRTLRTWLVVLLALAWVPLTSHCRIEALIDVGFLQCEADAPANHAGQEHGKPCGDEDNCCAVEFAKYPSSRQQDFLPAFLPVFLPSENSASIHPPLPAGGSPGILTPPPPDLPVSWQFSLRAALPPRAPSIAS